MKKENENYIKMALEDLESSKILYENKKYPQSIFLLQQSVEKTTKGITEIFNHSHRTSKIYKSIVNENLKEKMKFLENTLINNEEKFLAIISVIKSQLLEMDSPQCPLRVGKITIRNFPLQHILSPHASPTRYPQKEHNPLTKYEKNYFLIKHYQTIYNIQKECLKECFKFI